MARKESRLLRGEGRVTERPQQDGTVRYQARWREPGRDGTVHERAKTHATRAAAEAWLQEQARQSTRGVRPPADMTVGMLVDEMLDHARSRLSERTLLTYRQRAATMIAPALGSKRLIDLEPLDVQRWIARLGREGYQPATVHAAVAVLHAVLRDAKTLGLVATNAADGIRRPSITPPEVATWTHAEAQRVLALVRDDELYGALYHVALSTGMRPGELRALAWADVDLERGIITVRRTMTKDAQGRETISPRTKTKQVRAVALPAPIVRTLRRHRARQAERRLACAAWHDLDLVFDRGDGMWLGQNTWRVRHQGLCRRAGVPSIRCHDLRHSAATILMEQGVHPKVVSEILGHSRIQMTLDRYSHVSVELQQRAMDRLGDTLFTDADDEHDMSSGTTT